MTAALSLDQWENVPEILHLSDDEAHVWRFGLSAPEDEIALRRQLLDQSELERAERFLIERHHRRFIVAHGAMRIILGRYVDRPPQDLRFTANAFGKPTLADIDSERVEFSLAHSREMGLLAVARVPVGVDIEWMRQSTEIESISRRYFSEAELARLQLLSFEQRRKAFFFVWTRKEAYLKALGVGLHRRLDAFEASVDDAEGEFRLFVEGRSLDWTLYSLPVAEEYAAAVAISSPGISIKAWKFIGDD